MGSTIDDRVALTAQRLAIRFTEDSELPSRFRRRLGAIESPRKAKKDSDIEKRFIANIDSWRRAIEVMLSKLESSQAWRFINSTPAFSFSGTITSVAENKDFCDFLDYLVIRRDVEQCDSDELGCLAILSVAFQREIENRLI